MADGSIIIDTKLDTSGIMHSRADIERASKAAAASLKVVNQDIKAQEKVVAGLQKELAKVTQEYQDMKDVGVPATGPMYSLEDFSVEKIAPAQAAVDKAKANLDGMRAASENLRAENEKLVASKKKVDAATKRTARNFENASKRIMGLAKRVFIYSILLQAFHKVVDYVSQVSQTSDELMTALANLRGALATAFAPIWEAILPALIQFINFLTKAILVIASFFSWLTGKPLDNSGSLYKKADAIKKVGGAADKASKSLAGFDEINNINTNESAGGGSSGANAAAFNFDNKFLKETADLFKQIGDYVVAIIIALAVLSVATAFGATLTTAIGLALVFAGLYLTIKGFIDAWNNGIDWDNLTSMLAGIAGIVAGLAIIFGAVGAAIGAIVGGITLLVVGIKDWIDSGNLSTETMTAISIGLILIGAAIALLTGLWIPLVIAAVAALVVVIIRYWEDIKAFFVRLWRAISGFFIQLWEDIKAIWNSVAQWFYNNVISPVVEFFRPIIELISGIFEGLWIIIQAIWKIVSQWFNDNVIQPLINFFKPIIEIISTIFKTLWTAIKTVWNAVASWFNEKVIQPIVDFFTKAWETIRSAFEKAFKAISDFAKGIFNGVIGFIEGIINRIIRGINNLIEGFNKVVTWAAGVIGTNWKGLSLLREVSLPRLAQGAVVPQNRQFAAILGDNKHETEVVSPLSTMKQALIEALQDAGGDGQPITILLDGEVIYRNVVRRSSQASKRTGRNPVMVGG